LKKEESCRVEDSMEHILTECDVPGQGLIWNLTKALWLKKQGSWPNRLNMGNIIGCSLIEVKSQDGEHQTGAERLYRIIMSEAAYLIWKIRCH